jgi:hypothetical protein
MKSKKKDKEKAKQKDKKVAKGSVRVVQQQPVAINFWEVAGTNNTHQLQNAALAKGIGKVSFSPTYPKALMPKMHKVVHFYITPPRQVPMTWLPFLCQSRVFLLTQSITKETL